MNGQQTQQILELIDPQLAKCIERVDEITEIIRLAYRENRLDIVDDMIDELHAIEARLEWKAPLQ